MIPNHHTIARLEAEVADLKRRHAAALARARVAEAHLRLADGDIQREREEAESLRALLRSARRVARGMAREVQARDVVLRVGDDVRVLGEM